MVKKILVGIGLLGLLGILVVPALAADTASVSATVTPRLISITVSPTSTDYGIMGTNESKIAPDTFTLTNDGNVVEDINIRGTSTAAWTLSDTAIGSEQFMHKARVGATWIDDASVVALATTNKLFIDNMAVGSQNFRLKIYTPSSTAATAAQSTTVTLVASYAQ